MFAEGNMATMPSLYVHERQYGAPSGAVVSSPYNKGVNTGRKAQASPGQDRAGIYTMQAGGHRAFLPKPLPPDPPLVMNEALLALLSAADRELGRLDGAIQILPNPDLFVLMFVRREAVLSSQIEGTQSSLRDLLEAEARVHDPQRPADIAEVSNYVAALSGGMAALASRRVSVGLLLDLHERLMRGGRGSDLDPGSLRTDQVWIGPPDATLEQATFVPPPPDHVAGALSELERYIRAEDATPVLIRAGLAHAQFETIHPFFDGNGRMGRLLIILVLCEQGILGKPVLYLSHFFKMHRSRYYAALQAVRDDGDWEGWMEFFLAGVVQVAHESSETARRIVALREDVRERLLQRLGRAAGNALRLHEQLFRTPILSVSAAAESLGITYGAANRLIGALVREGVLTERTGHARNRRFAYQRYIDLFAD